MFLKGERDSSEGKERKEREGIFLKIEAPGTGWRADGGRAALQEPQEEERTPGPARGAGLAVSEAPAQPTPTPTPSASKRLHSPDRRATPTHPLTSLGLDQHPRLRTSRPLGARGPVPTPHNPPRRPAGALSEGARPQPPGLSKVRQRVSRGLLGNAVYLRGWNRRSTHPQDYVLHNAQRARRLSGALLPPRGGGAIMSKPENRAERGRSGDPAGGC